MSLQVRGNTQACRKCIRTGDKNEENDRNRENWVTAEVICYVEEACRCEKEALNWGEQIACFCFLIFLFFTSQVSLLNGNPL